MFLGTVVGPKLHDLVRARTQGLKSQSTPASRQLRKKSRAISWFKDTAHEHIGHICEMVAILENHGVSVRMLKADKVGYVVYEDDYQSLPEPFSDVQC